MIDLQAHTTASDGSLTPAELVRLARRTGLSALAITDHDTVAGLDAAIEEAIQEHHSLEIVPGIEISVDYPQGEFHLLGYFIDFRDPSFRDRVEHLQANRAERNEVMIRKMEGMGFDITLADVLAEAGGGQVGRPHMAAALVRKGYAANLEEAFDQYVGDGKPLHVPKVKLSPAEAIALVHSAGGVAVLAHPKYLRFDDEEDLATHLAQLKEAGLEGLECYYSQHTDEETALYLRMAERFGFLVTAGSDFHGVGKGDVELGRIYQGRAGDDHLLEALRGAALAKRS